MKERKILVSGIQPSGKPHIGNYFGMMRQTVEMQKEYESRIFIVDLHALTSLQDPKEMSENIVDIAIDYLSIGLDPKSTLLYKQSDVPEITELAWIFNCITTMPYLMRAHAFKDAEAKNREINVGVFDYPMLMAADILIHDADIVPVGFDQKQHLEIAADTAEKFNRIFGDTFNVPKAYIRENVGTIPGTDGRKMSKSYKNTINLFATEEEIKDAVMSITTDSKTVSDPKDPETDKVFAIHKLFTEGQEYDELRGRYQAGDIGYKESKEILIKNIIKFINPLREKRSEMEKNKSEIVEILKEGGKKARKIAEDKMSDVRKKIGVSIY
ncbi:MAG TPA: tryptophan--tRNA ligase [Candidatus Paceibacterota bacterium]